MEERRQSPNHYLVYEGSTFTVEFYYTTEGKMPAYEYYRTLSEEDEMRFFVIVKHLADQPIGTIHPRTIYNLEDADDAIYAIKPHQHRFFSFTTRDRKLILTNAYKKRGQKMDKAGKAVLKRAKQMKEDYENRVSKGVYYA